MDPEPGMQIARLKTSTRDPRVCRVEVSGVGAFQLDCESAAAMGIYDGAPVSEAQVEALVVASARRAATAHAMRLLQRRPRSRADIAQALRRKGVDAHLTATVVADLQRTGWIDDVQFARLWVRDRLALRPSGRKRLRFELLAHGVSPALADDTLARALPADREGEVALAQARRRVARLAGLPREVAVRRLAGWLQRRGFSGEIVARVMRAVWSPRSETDA